MANRRFEEDVPVGLEYYVTEKEQQYSKELSEVRSHLEDRVKEVKTDVGFCVVFLRALILKICYVISLRKSI